MDDVKLDELSQESTIESISDNLKAGLKYIRLYKEIELIKDKQKQYKVNIVYDSDDIWNKIQKNTTNLVNNPKTNEYQEKLTKAVYEINSLTTEYPNLYKTIEECGQATKELFKEDKYGVNRLLFSLNYMLFDRFKYQFEDGLHIVSNILYNDENKLSELYKSLEKRYVEITKKPLSADDKFVLAVIGASCAVLSFMIPFYVVGGAGVSAAVTTSSLAAIGGTMNVGVGLLGLFAFLNGAFIMGCSYKLLDTDHKLEARQAFKTVSPEEMSLVLAIKCMQIEQLNKYLTTDMLKEEISNVLSLINDLKSDVDYMLFVENRDPVINKRKIDIFHNFDKQLIKAMGK